MFMKNALLAGIIAGLLTAAPAIAQTENGSTTSQAKSQTKNGAHTVGQGAKAVGEGTKDVAVGTGKKVGHGAKKAGHAVGHTAEKGADKVKDVAH